MKSKTIPPGRSWLPIAAALVATARPDSLWANPEGMTVVRGSATAQTAGSRLNVTVGQGAFLDWRNFNIQQGESTAFIQPSADAVVLNRINDNNPSRIWGSLTANGTVILANAHGFYFGPNSMIKVGGSFVATTAPITPDLGAAGAWQFTGLPPLADIVNFGQIEAGTGRSLFLIAEKIENHGSLQASGGTVGLQSGQEVLLSDRPDGRGLSASVRLPSGSIDNTGRIVADGGHIALRARVVNQDGIIQADSIREHNGVIELVSSQQLNLGPSSHILARGDDSSPSRGGDVTLKSGGSFYDHVGGQIITTGGLLGGSGGDVEVSAPTIASLESAMDARAQSGSRAGRLLLDPDFIELGTAASFNGSAGNGTIDAGHDGGTLRLNVNTAFLNKDFSAITLQAVQDITLKNGTIWNLSVSTGLGDGQLTLQAGRHITFEDKSRLTDPGNWSVRLEAGVDFSSGAIRSGVGSIFLNGGTGLKLSGAIETARGSIELTAGDSVLVGAGFIRTVGGGSVKIRALTGDIDAGTKADGYEFLNNASKPVLYRVSAAGLGGIATAAGGNVTLEAGHDVISGSISKLVTSGAYGSQPGDVTVVAGHEVRGNYLVRNGTGNLLAGVTVVDGQVTQILNPAAAIGTAREPVSLSLVAGSWKAWAAANIFLGEVRNPNGTFNANNVDVPAGAWTGNISGADLLPVPAKTTFLFDYAATAAAHLWAGQGITLGLDSSGGSNFPRASAGQNRTMEPVYPPILTLNAGSGGIEVLNSITLFPSSQGALRIATRDGGSLTSPFQEDKLIGITMSDSGLPGWATFARGHATTPWHLNDAIPVRLDIAGDIRSFSLTVPLFAQIEVGGDTYNFGFLGRNLSPGHVTEIHVVGDIGYRGNLTTVPLDGTFPAEVIDPARSANPEVTRNLRVDATAGTLTFVGQMTEADLTVLLNPRVFSFDRQGRPLDANGVWTEISGRDQAIVSVSLTPAQQAALQLLFVESQSASLGDNGLQLAGPGQFKVRARDIDLGVSQGISVLGPDAALEDISPFGAHLDVTASRDLSMTSTRISNESYRGGIRLDVGGTLDVGGQLTTFGDAAAPKGIFTTGGGDIAVAGGGDVNVNGSRIASYNGGNLRVTSTGGDVNAGTGGAGYISMNALELNPRTGRLDSIAAAIPGSGLMATTLPGSSAQLGNITVSALQGDINASLGGIIQLAFNDSKTAANFINLQAGRDINAGGSGVIGSNIRLQAGRDINGVIIGSRTVDIASQRNVNVTAFGGQGVTINAGGAVSGTVVGGGAVSVSGDSITAALVSKNIATSGDTSGAALGLAQSNVTKADARTEDDAAAKTARPDSSAEDEEEKRKKAGTIVLARKTGRVTVILPPKNQ